MRHSAANNHLTENSAVDPSKSGGIGPNKNVRNPPPKNINLISLKLMLSTDYTEVRKKKFGLTVTLWGDFRVAMANFSMFSHDLFDAPAVIPVMY
jgi:hypothetical protein